MDSKVRVLWFGWLMLAPFLWYTMMARRTFMVPSSGAMGIVLAGISMISGILLAMWEGQHGTYHPVLWGAGTVFAVASVLLYESARNVVTSRGFSSVLSGAVPQAVCTAGPYRFMRHPVYTSYILAFLGLAVAFPGLPSAFVFVANLAFYVYAAADEERTIAHSEIGQAYASYRQGAGMFFPRFGR